jgi:hypothetical protein
VDARFSRPLSASMICSSVNRLFLIWSSGSPKRFGKRLEQRIVAERLEQALCSSQG